MGGASSHDIQDGVLEPDAPDFLWRFQWLNAQGAAFRVNHRSWWREELPSESEYAEARANLDRAGWTVDYLLTHCGPTSIQNDLLGPLSKPDAPHRLSGGDRPAVPVQVSLLRTLPQEQDRSGKMCAAIRADYTVEVEGNV